MLSDRVEVLRLVRFLAVGGLNTLVGYLLFAGFFLIGAGKGGAVVAATCLGILFNFQSIGRLVFKQSDGRLLPKFIVVYAIQALFNIGLLTLAERLGVTPLLGQLLVLPPVVLLTFFLMQRFVFKRGDPQARALA